MKQHIILMLFCGEIIGPTGQDLFLSSSCTRVMQYGRVVGIRIASRRCDTIIAWPHFCTNSGSCKDLIIMMNFYVELYEFEVMKLLLNTYPVA